MSRLENIGVLYSGFLNEAYARPFDHDEDATEPFVAWLQSIDQIDVLYRELPEALWFIELLYALKWNDPAMALRLGLAMFQKTESREGQRLLEKLRELSPLFSEVLAMMQQGSEGHLETSENAECDEWTAPGAIPYPQASLEDFGNTLDEIDALITSGEIPYPHLWLARAILTLGDLDCFFPFLNAIKELRAVVGADEAHYERNNQNYLKIIRENISLEMFTTLINQANI